jgi:ATP-dependent DNA ligase
MLKQIDPAKAQEYPKDRKKVFNNPEVIGEFKHDDVRAIMHISKSGNYFTTRIQAKDTGLFIEKTNHVPHLSKPQLPDLNNTILDGGLGYAFNTKMKSSDVMKILGCLPDKAVQRQEESGKLDYVVWDILFLKGVDLRDEPWHIRRECLAKIFVTLKKQFRDNIYLSDVVTSGIAKFYNSVVAKGGEGIMLKDRKAKYGSGWYKLKKQTTYDVFVMGFEEPEKYSIKSDGTKSLTKYYENDWIGAIIMGQMVKKDGVMYRKVIGTCSGFPDNIRKSISLKKESHLLRVFEVRAQERLPSGALRHPRFVRWRDDKPRKECIFDLKGGKP